MDAIAAPGSGPEPWLEIIDGDAPLLLIAPHGGRAGAAARATLHPKVNDLETAAITRELARRLGAPALINAAMDRNELDCNRLAQLAQRAPWLIDLIVGRVAAITRRYGRATVLLIHGWNVIEPRVDLGLGLREAGGRLRPPAGAHVSASDGFINGPVAALAARLTTAGIIPTFGLRYPGGASQNLLQAFTQRHCASELAALRELAALAAHGAIDALQLEMSVAVRMPGALRASNLDAIAEAFAPATASSSSATSASSMGSPAAAPAMIVVRDARPRPARVVSATPAGAAMRIGVEFYDPDARVGGMASFDFGAGAAGARIMVMFDGCHAALFTGEGKSEFAGAQIHLGPLSMTLAGGRGGLSFRGPAMVVDDGAAYLSVERALAGGQLDTAMELAATIELDDCGAPACDASADDSAPGDSDLATAARAGTARFGRLRGALTVGGVRREIDAVARVGTSCLGLGAQRFTTRRMLWACFSSGGAAQSALEARTMTFDGAPQACTARILDAGAWRECELGAIDLDTPVPGARPGPIHAAITLHDGVATTLSGRADNFMTLSRPGLDATRIHTSLGFATYQMGDARGAGMFEYSRVVGVLPSAAGDSDDADSD
ncbi:MAG: hypothetical protein IVW56_04870 [Candidatus Binataceae bacterium]|nr:hypothetical protein [Candidatus Binataceae bacterium]